MTNGSQKSLEQDKKDDGWKLVDFPKDESFISLGVGEELEGRFVGEKTNYFGRLYYIIQKNGGDIVKLNDTTNLHKWMESVEPGDIIKIVRKKDKRSPEPDKNPLQIYEVYSK